MNNKVCCVCGSITKVYMNKAYGNLLCQKHRGQLQNYNKFLDSSPKSKYDKNHWEVSNDGKIAKGELLNSRYEITGYVIIDSEDLDKVLNIKWRIDQHGYVFNNNKESGNVFIHNLLVNKGEFDILDHKDRNPLNNRKENLRPAMLMNNCRNKKVKSDNTSGITGISANKDGGWRSRINVNYKELKCYYGYDFDEAVKHRVIAESQYFKEFSPNYNPDTHLIELKYLSLKDNLETYISCNMSGVIINFTKGGK